MWNRRRTEEQTPASSAALPRAVELEEQGPPMSRFPARGEDTIPPDASALGRSVIVKGRLFGSEDLTIDGEVEGTVELPEHRLTVGPNGKVTASIKARE